VTSRNQPATRRSTENDQPDSGLPNQNKQRQHLGRVTRNRGNRRSAAFNRRQTPISTSRLCLTQLISYRPDIVTRLIAQPCMVQKRKERKSIYIALFWPRWYTQSAQAWITQSYLQITPCLPFLRERSPDVTTTGTEAADI